MTQVPFSPTGIALKQHELYGLDDDQLLQEARHLQTDIVSWSIQHFILDDYQKGWLLQTDDKFRVEFAKTVAKGISNRYDINIEFIGPPRPKSKNIGARDSDIDRRIDISVIRIST